MRKYINYIYLTICEVSLSHYKGSNSTHYPAYCKGIARALNSTDPNNLSRNEIKLITSIIDMLDKIYSLSTDETSMYILDYFELDSDKHIEFQLVALSTIKISPIN